MTRRTRMTTLARYRGAAGAMAASAGLLLTGLATAPGASAAEAGTDAETAAKPVVCAGDVTFGIACFDPDGDHLRVEDLETDGWRIEARWATDYGRAGTCAIPTGKDYRDCNYDMAEGRELYFEVHAINEKFNLHEVLGHNWAVI
ncbi:hypothetical protein GCM10009584_31350 [Ornithinimicrobium humiphilum]|uniref:Secreted protein n=1 Tax=Ornithinimicrobium humiphilum TaxID=125288 RepID=A0A543K5E7_9MICO|nr:hypothetical protein [Ornithinimicrobium humiphilum]TQM90300.1 hypothetical protein FB476_3253 [Ornithinimicrobium humiphilum]